MDNNELLNELIRINKLTNKEICDEFHDLLESSYNVHRKLLGEELAYQNKIIEFDDHYQLKFNYVTIDFYEEYMKVRIDCIHENKLALANKELPQFNFNFSEPDPEYEQWRSISFKEVPYFCVPAFKTIILYFL